MKDLEVELRVRDKKKNPKIISIHHFKLGDFPLFLIRAKPDWFSYDFGSTSDDGRVTKPVVTLWGCKEVDFYNTEFDTSAIGFVDLIFDPKYETDLILECQERDELYLLFVPRQYLDKAHITKVKVGYSS
jgi:hypothetical protein